MQVEVNYCGVDYVVVGSLGREDDGDHFEVDSVEPGIDIFDDMRFMSDVIDQAIIDDDDARTNARAEAQGRDV